MNLLDLVFKLGGGNQLFRSKILTPFYMKHRAKQFGKNVTFTRNFITSNPQNLSLGDDVAIGPNCIFYSTNAEIIVGRGVMFAPNVMISTGEHRTDIIGEFMRYVGEDRKLPENDKPVVVEDDCWIGSNVTILKGTTIGRGSIIHAGAVVSGKVKPYTIYISDKLKMSRFTDEEIQEHERLLKEKYGVTYPEYHPKDRAISRV